jgi:hypothetical protein
VRSIRGEGERNDALWMDSLRSNIPKARPLVVENTVNRMRKVNRPKRPRFRVAPWGNARGDGLALGRWGVIGVSHGA